VIANAIAEVSTLSFPRKYSTSLLTPPILLNVFADASLKAYGAVAYIQQDQDSPSLVMSSSTHLPRLELRAAVLAAKLVKTSLNLDCAVQL